MIAPLSRLRSSYNSRTGHFNQVRLMQRTCQAGVAEATSSSSQTTSGKDHISTMYVLNFGAIIAPTSKILACFCTILLYTTKISMICAIGCFQMLHVVGVATAYSTGCPWIETITWNVLEKWTRKRHCTWLHTMCPLEEGEKNLLAVNKLLLFNEFAICFSAWGQTTRWDQFPSVPEVYVHWGVLRRLSSQQVYKPVQYWSNRDVECFLFEISCC